MNTILTYVDLKSMQASKSINSRLKLQLSDDNEVKYGFSNSEKSASLLGNPVYT